MKKSLNLIGFSLFLFCCSILTQVGLAQAPPPPPADKGTNNNKAPGGGAPIDGGLAVSLALVAGFGTWKITKGSQKRKQTVEN